MLCWFIGKRLLLDKKNNQHFLPVCLVQYEKLCKNAEMKSFVLKYMKDKELKHFDI